MDKDFKVVSEVDVTGDDPFADLDAESGDVVDHGHSSDDNEVELTRLDEQVCDDPPDLEIYMYLNFNQDIVSRIMTNGMMNCLQNYHRKKGPSKRTRRPLYGHRMAQANRPRSLAVWD